MKVWKTTLSLMGLSMYLSSRIDPAKPFGTGTGMPAGKIAAKRLAGWPQPWDAGNYLACFS
jgi:hypothetical protein